MHSENIRISAHFSTFSEVSDPWVKKGKEVAMCVSQCSGNFDQHLSSWRAVTFPCFTLTRYWITFAPFFSPKNWSGLIDDRVLSPLLHFSYGALCPLQDTLRWRGVGITERNRTLGLQCEDTLACLGYDMKILRTVQVDNRPTTRIDAVVELWKKRNRGGTKGERRGGRNSQGAYVQWARKERTYVHAAEALWIKS